jgi:GT2 family glycosyltransferase
MIHGRVSVSGRIGVVIPSFKDETLVLKCIDSILALGNPGTEIVVVDCLSEELPRICKKKYGDRVHVIYLNHDVGVAEQRNIGFRYSMRISDYTLFLDNDTELQENAIEKLVEAIEYSPECAIFQPKIVSLFDGKRILEIGLASRIFGIPKPIRDSRGEPFFGSGSAILFRNDLLRATGGFDAVFQFGAEELDLTWRARLLGYDIKTVPEAVVCHRTQGTRKRLSSERLYLGLRNTIRMLLKNYSAPANLFFATLLVVRSGVESSLFVCINKLTRRYESNVASLATSQNSFSDLVVAFARAVLWNIARMRDTITQHNKIQAKRVTKDKEIVRLMRKNDLLFVSPAYRKTH